jgi:hypothetical protein
MKRTRDLPCAFAALLLATASCAPIIKATYTPPASDAAAENNWSRTIARPFDQVWSALVEHVAQSFFGIESFEKASGLMTLAFGASDIGEFVDGGQWNYNQSAGADPQGRPIPSRKFTGNYADYVAEEGGSLSGRMNLIIKDLGDGTTQVTVRARYVVSCPILRCTWTFNTGGQQTILMNNPSPGTPQARTLRPTHAAEKSILQAVEALTKVAPKMPL